MALYGNLLEALDSFYGADVMQKVYTRGVELGLSGNEQWGNYYKLLAENTDGLIEYTTASGKPVGLWSVQGTTSTTTELVTTSTANELVTVDMAMGTEVGEYAGEIIPKLSTVGAEGSTTVGSFVVGEVLPAIGAAAAGVVLGVAVDSVLYNSNPDYWDEKLPTLNPQTWDDIVLGHDTKIPFLHNTETGKTYIKEDFLGYTAMVGDKENWFSSGKYDSKTDSDNFFNGYTANVVTSVNCYLKERYSTESKIETITITDGYFISMNNGSSSYPFIYIIHDVQKNPTIYFNHDGKRLHASNFYDNSGSYTYNNKTVGISSRTYSTFPCYDDNNNYVSDFYIYSSVPNTTVLPACSYPSDISETQKYYRLGWVGVFGNFTVHHDEPVEGINKIGVVPDLGGATSLDNVLSKLRTTYPDLYDNSIDVPYYDKNTDSVTHSTWLPTSIPSNFIDNDGSTTNKPNNKPTTNNLNQTNDGSYPDNNTENQAKENTITQSSTPEPPSNINPVNPILPSEQTPPIVVPSTQVDTGLGAVYVPTISELRSFSEWLWSPNFIDQIKKLFSDPMQGIIGLHQVYFTPSHDGNDTIHCGYLDSEVSSDYTTTRYIKVNCGSVNVKETFGNVFDYDPLTTIECYLPFIGIVPLKVGDVMRSTISIEYVCDVLTGACLCNIYVNRDGAKCVLYSYGGNCAVNYPLSSGSYMGIVSSLVGVGLSIGSAIATGGASIPLSVAGGAISMMNAHTNVKTSGGYGGNTGAMGIKKPYLIIKNTLSAMPDNYNKYIGNPYNNTKKINECRGFTQANVLHLNGDMLQQEKEEIINLFNSGVII